MSYAPIETPVTPLEPIAAEAAVLPAGPCFVDPAVGPVGSWDEYYERLTKLSKSGRHYSNPEFRRGEMDFWIGGQCAVTPHLWSKYVMFIRRWTSHETQVFQARLQESKERGRVKYSAMLARRKTFHMAMRDKLRDTRSYRFSGLDRASITSYRTKFFAEGRTLGYEMGKILKLKETAPFAANEYVWMLRFDKATQWNSRIREFLSVHFPEVMNASLNDDTKVRSIIDVKAWVAPLRRSQDYRSDRRLLDPEQAAVTPQWPEVEKLLFSIRRHYLHQSFEEPTAIAYAQSYAHFKAGRWTRTTFGRYLTKFFGHMLNEVQIREAANRYVAAHKPLVLHITPNTDPDGWEWVYEHGTGFKSCMTATRSDCYINSDALAIMHPVRAYACTDNDLALAWIGDRGTEEVWGRAIINTKTKTFVRAYGDDRLLVVLEHEGYKRNPQTTMIDALMHAVPVLCKNYGNEPNRYIAPYLDAGQYSLIKHNDALRFKVVTNGGVGSNSDGTIRISVVEHRTCHCCGQEKQYDPTRSDNDQPYIVPASSVFPAYPAPEGGMICISCLRDKGYSHGFSDMSRNYKWLKASEAVYDSYNDRYILNDEEVLTYYDMVKLSDPGDTDNPDSVYWYKGDIKDVPAANGGNRRVRSGRTIYLDYYYYGSDGRKWEIICIDDAVRTSYGNWAHKDDVMQCSVSGSTYHKRDIVTIGGRHISISMMHDRTNMRRISAIPTADNPAVFAIDFKDTDQTGTPDALARVLMSHPHLPFANVTGIEYHTDPAPPTPEQYWLNLVERVRAYISCGLRPLPIEMTQIEQELTQILAA